MADTEPAFELDRRLIREDPEARKVVTIEQVDIATLSGPIVILGDPGIGKSILAKSIGRLPGFTYVRAASFVRNAHPERLISAGECLVIDGLDEIASAAVGGGVDAVLRQLSKMGFPRFILSSREVDWRGASDRIKIEDDYGQQATLLHLLPFDADDAERFLASNFPKVDAKSVLEHLAERGLDDIYKNPLTLRLIGEIADTEEALPSSRAELLDRACRVLVTEENPRHQDSDHTKLTTDDLLLAAGAHAASQLLCDLSGVFTGAEGKTPENYAHVSWAAALPFGKAAEATLHTRLFEAGGEGRFHLLHRVLAEYLGAKWLAACFASGVSARRILGLFGEGAGIPTSLRGFHAWIAHFDHVLAERCIAADPYAVLRYGDAETMPVSVARKLLQALTRLSEQDPYFRAEDWAQHPAAGLIKSELKADILAIISTPEEHTHLTMLIVEAMAGSALTDELRPELTAMMFDQARYFAERSRAADALRQIGAIEKPAEAIERLIQLGDEDSLRLSWEVAHDTGLAKLPMLTAVRSFLAYIGVTVSDTDRSEDRLDLAHLSDESIDALDLAQLGELLDLLHEFAQPLFEEAKHSARAQVADLVMMATLRALTLDGSMPTTAIWRRVGWVPHTEGYKRETRVALTAWLEGHPSVRRAIQTHVMLDAGMATPRDGHGVLYFAGLDLHLTSDDIVALLEEVERRQAGATIDLVTLEELVQLDRRQEGISAQVRSAAERLSGGSAPFIAKLEEWSQPIVYDWERKQAENAASQTARREAIHQMYRDDLATKPGEVDTGTPNLLYDPAKVYLGRFTDFDREAPPENRVREFLGEPLADRVLAGFRATLLRDELPGARVIAEHHADDKHWYVELPLVCGVAERLRLGITLDDLPAATRESAFMSWRRCAESNIVGGVDLKLLEAAVLVDDAATERFFRDSIEPQLERKRAHLYDLYFLGHDPRWKALAGKLSIEWLRRFPDLPAIAEGELLACATRHGNLAGLRALTRERRRVVHRNYDTMLGWLALDFLADFDDRLGDLEEAADDDRDFLWFVRNRVSGERDDPERRLSIAQQSFIVERFGRAWPKTTRPQGASHGDTNPWDATAAIEHAGYALGGDPGSEATAALEHLIDSADPSYADPLRHALALQLRARRDAEFRPLPWSGLRAVITNALPATIDDMRAYFADRLDTLGERMHHSNTNMWQVYWNNDKPHVENYSRDRLIEQISGQLPEAIRFEPEMTMPLQKRADIAAILGKIGLPVEIKRQWHAEIWTAPLDQLAAKYAHEWHAEGRGAYIVIWFGSVPGRSMAAHPAGLPPPTTPEQLRSMLIDLLPPAYRDVIDVHVVDVSRPTSK